MRWRPVWRWSERPSEGLGGKGRWEAGVNWYADAINRVPTVLRNELRNTVVSDFFVFHVHLR